MFSRQLLNGDPTKATKILDPKAPNYRMGDYSYGKRAVRVFQLKRDGPVHAVTEYEVSSHQRLRSHKEYYEADNSEIIGSDVAETTVLMHAKQNGLTTPEEFALSLTQRFLDAYELIMETNVIVEELAWERIGEHEDEGYYKDKKHNHAFTRLANGTRFCEVVRKRVDSSRPLLMAGLKNMRVVKTAMAPFTGYVKGSLYTEGDMPDRILCTDLNAKWQYSKIDGIDFNKHWHQVREVILRSFAGDPVKGVVTTSVQYVAYQAERAVLDAIPEICSVSINLPNYLHLPYDFSRFPAFETKTDVVISNPNGKAYGIGYAQLDRLEE